MTIKDVRVIIFGEAAVVTGTYHTKGTYNSRPYQHIGIYRHLGVLRWKVGMHLQP